MQVKLAQKTTIQFKLTSKIVLIKNDTIISSINNRQFYLLLCKPNWLVISQIKLKKQIERFDIIKIKNIQIQFAKQGKCTIQIYNGKKINIGSISMNGLKQKQNITKLLLSASNQQTIMLLRKKIIQMINNFKSNFTLQIQQHQIKRKRQLSNDNLQIKKANRKLNSPKILKSDGQLEFKMSIQTLTSFIFKLILEYVGKPHIIYRNICKFFDQQIRLNLYCLKFKSDVPQEIFNKMTRNLHKVISGKAKNVTNLIWRKEWVIVDFRKMKKLMDKQISLGSKLIKLILPYNSRITYKKLMYLPISLVNLKLIPSSQICERNQNIEDKYIWQLLNKSSTLIKISIARCSHFQNALSQRTANNLKKLEIFTLELPNDIIDELNFQMLTNLKSLYIHNTISMQSNILNKKIQNLRVSKVQKMILGKFVSKNMINSIPDTIQKLTISSQIISKIWLQNLKINPKILDIRNCPYLLLDSLLNFKDIKVLVNWEQGFYEDRLFQLQLRNITIINYYMK